MDGKGDFQNGQDSAKESSEQVAKLRETIGKYAPYVGAASGAIFGANLMSPNILSRYKLREEEIKFLLVNLFYHHHDHVFYG